MSDKDPWTRAQAWEVAWHGSCANTYHEETKQLHYAARMGLTPTPTESEWPTFDLHGQSVLDIGGGPCSLLLKCRNVVGTVLDPGSFPDWTVARYIDAGILLEREPAEDWKSLRRFDEIWLYNCLQHTRDPEAVVRNARCWGDLVRVYEWIDTEVNEGHPHSLSEAQLNEWFGAEGLTETNGRTRAWYGIFAGTEPQEQE